MDWLKKLLEEQGLSAEQTKAITTAVEENYNGYVPKHRFDEVNNAKKQAETDLKERDKQLEKLSKSAGDNEELKQQIKVLQDENKAATEKYNAEVAQLKISTALKLALSGDAHDADLVASLINRDSIKLKDDGTIESGLDDQVKALRDSKPFLFVEKDNQPPKFKGSKPPEGSGSKGTTKKPSEMNYEELCAYIEANPGAEI